MHSIGNCNNSFVAFLYSILIIIQVQIVNVDVLLLAVLLCVLVLDVEVILVPVEATGRLYREFIRTFSYVKSYRIILHYIWWCCRCHWRCHIRLLLSTGR